MRGRSGKLTASPPAMIDDSRIGASIPHPSADAGGAAAASALAPSAISFARQVEAASPFGAGGGDSAGGLSGAPSSVGRGGGNGGSSGTALTGAHETPSANAASASRRPAGGECTAMNPSVKPQPRALVGNSSLERHERVDFRGRCERTAPVLFGFGLKVSRSRGGLPASAIGDKVETGETKAHHRPRPRLRGGAGQAGQRDAVEERNRRLTRRGAKRDELQQFRGRRSREGHGSRHPAGEAPRRDIHRRVSWISLRRRAAAAMLHALPPSNAANRRWSLSAN